MHGNVFIFPRPFKVSLMINKFSMAWRVELLESDLSDNCPINDSGFSDTCPTNDKDNFSDGPGRDESKDDLKHCIVSMDY